MNRDENGLQERTREIFSWLYDDHREIRGMADRLGAMESTDGLAAVLQETRSMLSAHYTREELEGGLYESLNKYGREFKEELHALKEQHDSILRAIDELSTRVKAAPQGEPALIDDAKLLADKIHLHERKETQFAAKVLRLKGDGDK